MMIGITFWFKLCKEMRPFLY